MCHRVIDCSCLVIVAVQVKFLINEGWRFKKLPGDEIDQGELSVKVDSKVGVLFQKA